MDLFHFYQTISTFLKYINALIEMHLLLSIERIIRKIDKTFAEKKRTPQVNPKTGKKRPDSKHSDLYTDEDPKGTITGLGFKNRKVALESIKKINNNLRRNLML